MKMNFFLLILVKTVLKLRLSTFAHHEMRQEHQEEDITEVNLLTRRKTRINCVAC